jgi:hypothetical protein
MTPDNSGGSVAAGGAAEIKKPREDKRYYRRESKKPVSTTRTTIKQQKFEGKNEDLRGHVYDCSNARQSDIFMKTTKEISEYVGSNFKYGSDTRLAIESLSLPILDEPVDYADNATKTQIRKWEKLVDECVKRETYLTQNLKTVYSIVWGQCTDACGDNARTP